MLEAKKKYEILPSYTFGGRTQTVKQWAKEKGINYHTLRLRLKEGMSIEDALSKPVRKYEENPDYDLRSIEIGMRFEKWEVIGFDVNKKYLHCRCECGSKKRVKINNLRNGVTKSCGICGEFHGTHGGSNTRTYKLWMSMNSRVKNHINYIRKGITVCERWSGPNGFVNFLADMGECPPDKRSLDRHPNKAGNYEPGNCRWANDQEQREKSNTKKYEFNGKEQTLFQWADEYKMQYTTLSGRMERGWSLEKSLTTPVGKRRGQGVPQQKDHLIEYKGKTQTVTEWAIEFGLNMTTMLERLTNEWSMERIEQTPQGIRGGHTRAKEFQQKLREQEMSIEGRKRIRTMTSEDARNLLHELVDGLTPPQLQLVLNTMYGGDVPLLRMPNQIPNGFLVNAAKPE